jgi:RHS repeat-associated protein
MDFTEMYRYSVGGLMVGKRMQLSPNPDPNKPWPKDAETSNLDSTFTYDNEGQYLGPQGYPNWPQSFSYSTDTLGRPTGITASPLNPGDDPRVVVKDVIYGVAGELQQARIYKEPAPYTYVTTYLKRTWNYNTLFQATRETVVNEEGGTSTTVLDLQYSYTAGQNNGRITQRTEAVSGEQVSYSYDSLNRLIQAVTTGPQYGLSWTYDGFGNMTTQQVTKGSGYNTNLSYNGLTNRITTPGYGYDANGNLTAMPALTMQYDVQNRMVSSTSSSGGTKVYAYGPGGQRVGQSMPPDPNNWQNNSWTIYMYGPDGRRIADCGADYQPADPQYPQQNLSIQSGCGAAYIHFRGTLVRKENLPQFLDGRWQYRWEWPGTTMAVDRLGSVDFSTWGVGSTTSYYPYGEEETPTGNDTQKFATYWRDSATGLDYAQNRYYASQIGRFTTADPYRRSAKRRNPQSWNRYTYVLNDPVNANDPTGLDPMCLVTGVGVTGPDMQGCGYNAMFSVAPDGLPTPSTDPTMNSTAEPGQPTIPVDSSGAPGAPSATVIAPVVPVEPVASPVTGGIIISGSYTDSSLGGLAGFGIGSLFGPEGSAIGLLFGSMIGVGGNLSLVPSTDSWYLGVILTFTPVFFGGTGTALSVVDVPSGQDPNAIANGYSTSVGTQINPWTGYTVVTSPNNGTAQGPQWGTKSPVTVGASYNMCVWNCQP